MIGEFGETVVIDWGIALTQWPSTPAPGSPEAGREDAPYGGMSAEITHTGEYLGTPHYMAPEQARGDRGEVSPRTDVYALGAVLYELLTGRRCFEAPTPHEVLVKVLHERPVPVRDFEPKAPVDLVAICERAMAYRPEDRYASAGEVAQEIQRFQNGALVEAHHYTARERIQRLINRHRVGFTGLMAAAMVVALVVAWSFLRIVNEQARTQRMLYITSVNLALSSVEDRHLEDARQALSNAPAVHRHLEWGLLEKLSSPEVLHLPQHAAHFGAFSPDGALIATCGRDEVTLWDAMTGHQNRIIPHAHDIYHRLDWSPDGRLIAASTPEEAITIWDTTTGERLHALSGYDPVFSADGAMLAAITDEGLRATLFDTATGAPIRALAGAPAYMIRLAFSPDGTLLAGAVGDGSVIVWETAGRLLWQAARVHAPSTRWVEFSPSGTRLLSAGVNRQLVFWEPRKGGQLGMSMPHPAGISCARFSPDERLVYCAGARSISIANAETGLRIAALEGFPVMLDFVSLSPDGTRLVTHTAQKGDTRACEVRSTTPWGLGTSLTPAHPVINALAFDPAGTLLMSAGGTAEKSVETSVRLWNTRSQQLERTIETGLRSTRDAVFFPDGQRIAVMDHWGNAAVLDVSTGQALRVLSRPPGPGSERPKNPAGAGFALSPDGSLLATPTREMTVLLWDTTRDAPPRVLTGHTAEVSRMAFSQDGRWLVSGGLDSHILVWDAVQGILLHQFRAHPDGVHALSLSADGTLLATGGGYSGELVVWETSTGREIRRFRGHTGIVSCVVFSRDGKRLLSGGTDAALRVWDVETGEQILLLSRHPTSIRALALTTPEHLLASGADEGEIVLWSIGPWN
jgi:WD40 repeat protein